jgi:hypothetical protein
MPDDRDPPIEEPDEFSDLARQLGDALERETPAPAGGAAAGDAAGQPNDPVRWERDYARSGGAGAGEAHGFEPTDASEIHGFESEGPAVSVGGNPGLGERLREQRLNSGCARVALLLILLVLVTFISCITIFDRDGDGELVGGGGSGVSLTPTASVTASSTATAAPTENPLQTGEDILDAINTALGVIWQNNPMAGYFFDDAIGDWLDSISGRTPTYTSPVIDLRYHVDTRYGFDLNGVNEAYNESIFECGVTAYGRTTVCAADVQPMPAGEVLVFAMLFVEEVPQASAGRSFIYSAVFDSDGDPANDWQFFAPYDFDLFQGADRWYQLIWDHNAQVWSLDVSQVDTSRNVGSYTGSAARVVVQGDTIVFFIPASEFELELPPYRLTSFGHDGAYSESDRGADVTGVDPTEPLQVPTSDVQTTSP